VISHLRSVLLFLLAFIFAPSFAFAGTPVEVTSFGSNPGNLRMYEYVPASAQPQAPLVVGLHGCGGTGPAFAEASGWMGIADANGVVLVLPEQKDVNNSQTCFNWFLSYEIERDSGEAASIKQMVDSAMSRYSLDATRVYVVGFSAGGAMAIVMLAAYPEVFAGGEIMAGVAYECATDVQGAFDCLNNGSSMTSAAWGDLVRAASTYSGPWPMVSIWQGGADDTVNPVNADAIRQQWTNVHGLGDAPSSMMTTGSVTYSAWKDGQGQAKVELYRIAGFPHAIPTTPMAGPSQCGTSNPPARAAGVCAASTAAAGWGLLTAHPPAMDGSTMGGTDAGVDASIPPMADTGGGAQDDAAAVAPDATQGDEPDGSEMPSPADAGIASVVGHPSSSSSGCACTAAKAPSGFVLAVLVLGLSIVSAVSRPGRRRR
jgi:poly(hydroxyalkanoate) depolymerase family esterase